MTLLLMARDKRAQQNMAKCQRESRLNGMNARIKRGCSHVEQKYVLDAVGDAPTRSE